eukprot:m.93721 g.93721  ORF g.93721 m.93721 type:complete len:551 (+) comp15381_c0_seq1:338-1990(+)
MSTEDIPANSSPTRLRGLADASAATGSMLSDASSSVGSDVVAAAATVAAESGSKSAIRRGGPGHSSFRETLRHSWPRSDSEPTATQPANPQLRLTDLVIGDVLGEGFFGRVYRAWHSESKQTFVLKELKSNHHEKDQFVREINILRSLSHPNIVAFVGIFSVGTQLHLVTEYIDGGTLRDLISNTNVELSWPTRVKMASDLANGLSYLRSRSIIHRDLKSENCMVRSATLSVVIVDFGLARQTDENTVLTSVPLRVSGFFRRGSSSAVPHILNSSRSEEDRPMSVVGSPYWMAPEIFISGCYGLQADVFSLGIVMCELISRCSADPDILPRTAAYGVDETKFRGMAGSCPAAFLSIALECCIVDPSERPRIQTVESRLRVMCMREDAAQHPLPAEAELTNIATTTTTTPAAAIVVGAAASDIPPNPLHAKAASVALPLQTEEHGLRDLPLLEGDPDEADDPRMHPHLHLPIISGEATPIAGPSPNTVRKVLATTAPAGPLSAPDTQTTTPASTTSAANNSTTTTSTSLTRHHNGHSPSSAFQTVVRVTLV